MLSVVGWGVALSQCAWEIFSCTESGRPLKVLLLVMAFFLQLQEGDYVEPDVLNLMDFRVCSPSS